MQSFLRKKSIAQPARAHFGLDTLLHAIVLGDLSHVGVDEGARLAHRELVLRDVKQKCLVQRVALLE